MDRSAVVNNECSLVSQALEQLRCSTHIEGRIVAPKDASPDLQVEMRIGSKVLQFSCDVKTKVDRHSILLDVMRDSSPTNRRPILVTTMVSVEMATRCRELDLQFIDAAGNAYISDGKGIFIFVAGKRTDALPGKAKGGSTITPSALRIMFAFLADPALLNAPYRDVAAQARVSTGVIGQVLDTLENRGLIGTTADGARMIRLPQLFLNEWAAGFASRLKPKLKRFHFTTEKLDQFRHWSPGYRISALGGGEGAAAHLTKHLNPEHFVVYLDMADPHALQDMVKHYRLRADPAGPIEVIDMFWNPDCFTNWFPSVPPHLVYADLIATHDPRNIEVAQQIAPLVIEHVHTSGR